MRQLEDSELESKSKLKLMRLPQYLTRTRFSFVTSITFLQLECLINWSESITFLELILSFTSTEILKITELWFEAVGERLVSLIFHFSHDSYDWRVKRMKRKLKEETWIIHFLISTKSEFINKRCNNGLNECLRLQF